MTVDREELEALSREELERVAAEAGVSDPEWLGRAELVDRISASSRTPGRLARSFFAKARSFVEQAAAVARSLYEESRASQLEEEYVHEPEARETSTSTPDEREHETREASTSTPDEHEARETSSSTPDEHEARETDSSTPDEHEARETSSSTPDEHEERETSTSAPDEREHEERETSSSTSDDHEDGTTETGAADEEVAEGEEAVLATATLAQVFETQGHTERALRMYAEVLARDPSDETARAGVARLGEAGPAGAEEARPDEVGLVALDATTLRASWCVGESGIARARALLGSPGHLVLRLFGAYWAGEAVGKTQRDEEGISPRGEALLGDVPPGSLFHAAIGVREESRFVPIARSGPVRTPAAGIEPSESIREAGHSDPSPVP